MCCCSFLQVVWGLIPLPWPKQARVLRLELFKVSRNRVFASKKIGLALEKLQKETHLLNFIRQHDGDFFDIVDQQVRIACPMFRDLKASPSKYATCIRKASTSEKETVDGALQHLMATDVGSEDGILQTCHRSLRTELGQVTWDTSSRSVHLQEGLADEGF